MIKVGVDNIILSKKREILLIRRSKESATYPLCWGFIGGWMEENELPLQALAREAKEEIGVETIKQVFLGQVFSNLIESKNITRIVLPYLAQVPDNAIFQLQKSEVCEIKWYSFEEALNLEWAYDHRDIFKYALDFGEIDKYLS